MNPFPTPVFTVKSVFSFNLTPNNLGNFALQMTVPYLVDDSVINSDVKYCVDPLLDGITTSSGLATVNILDSRVPSGKKLLIMELKFPVFSTHFWYSYQK